MEQVVACHVEPADECLPHFATSASLRETLKNVIAARENRRAEMIGVQEEMDWLCYEAYGLVFATTEPTGKVQKLSETERAFRLWGKAGDFESAVALIPESWSAERKKLWKERLTLIRDSEHIRRIEAPVYKRRWDEQWKVGNRWMAGPVA